MSVVVARIAVGVPPQMLAEEPMPPPPRLLALAILVYPVFPALAATIVIDSFTDALTLNPCLTNIQQPIVFSGPYCDGTACPPGPIRIDPPGGDRCNWSNQRGLAGVIPDARREIGVDGGGIGISVVGRIDPATSSWNFQHDANTRGRFGLHYWLDFSTVDLEGGGGERVRFTVFGDASPSMPIYCLIGLHDFDGNAAGWYEIITAPGEISLPISELDSRDAEFDLSRVAYIGLTFYNCEICNEELPSRHYAVGAILFDVGRPTAVARASWGHLKALYR